MKIILTLILILMQSTFLLSQEKWASFEVSIAGSSYVIVEACGDLVELSTGNWYEKMQITNFGSTIEGAGRQVIGDSVFFKYNLLDNSAPVLLYDYSVEMGDTVNNFWGDFIVTEVDTEFANGEDRKRITMENIIDGRLDIWVWGIGSKTSGYLQPGSPINIPDAGSEFSCYLNENSGEYYYGDKDPSLCAIPQTGSACQTTAVVEEENKEVVIFPNPADEFITIDINNLNGSNVIIRFFSVDGKQVVNKKDNSGNINLDVSGLTAGIYIIEINQNGVPSYHKVVIR